MLALRGCLSDTSSPRIRAASDPADGAADAAIQTAVDAVDADLDRRITPAELHGVRAGFAELAQIREEASPRLPGCGWCRGRPFAGRSRNPLGPPADGGIVAAIRPRAGPVPACRLAREHARGNHLGTGHPQVSGPPPVKQLSHLMLDIRRSHRRRVGRPSSPAVPGMGRARVPARDLIRLRWVVIVEWHQLHRRRRRGCGHPYSATAAASARATNRGTDARARRRGRIAGRARSGTI